MKLFSSYSNFSLMGPGSRVDHLSLGRGLGLRLCRKKELGKFHRELGVRSGRKGVAKKYTGWARNSEIHLGFNIGIIKL